MTKESLTRFLQSTGAINAAQAQEIAGDFGCKTLRKHDFLLQAGKISDNYFFLDQGFVRAFVYDADGNDVTTGFYTGGQVVFEVASFFNRTPSCEYIQALADCRGWCITHEQLNALFRARNEFREFGRSVLVRGLAALKGFEQPNVAILHVPFVWLPGGVVPLVLLAHVAALWQLRAASRLPLSEKVGQGARPASLVVQVPS